MWSMSDDKVDEYLTESEVIKSTNKNERRARKRVYIPIKNEVIQYLEEQGVLDDRTMVNFATWVIETLAKAHREDPRPDKPRLSLWLLKNVTRDIK